MRPQQHPRYRLAAIAGVRRRVRAVVDARDRDAKGREQAKQRGIHRDKFAHVEIAQTDSLLIGDHHQPVSRLLQFRETFPHAWQ